MKRLVLTVSAALLFTVTSWAQAAPANSPPREKPAGRATHHKAHPAQRHTPHAAARHAPHEAEQHTQRHAKRHHRRHSGA